MLSTNWSKAEKAFQKQLEFNIKELNSTVMPDHWLDVIDAANFLNPKSFLDIGCGVGTVYKIIQNTSPNISYKGIDYASAAIKVARDFWKYEGFDQFDFWDLSEKDVSDFDLVYVGALLNVFPNGDEALDFLLSLQIKNLLIGRMDFTEGESHYKEYTAYEEIETCAFYHDVEKAKDTIENKYGYKSYGMRWSLLLTK